MKFQCCKDACYYQVDSCACFYKIRRVVCVISRYCVCYYKVGTVCVQGMFIVSFPYTVLQGGYWSIISMVVIAYICCYTGKILVDCLYDDGDVTDHRSSGCADVITDRQRRRTRHSYVDIASAVWGRHFGSRVVYTAQLIGWYYTTLDANIFG